MRTERSAWMFCLFFLAVPAWSQQATSPGTQSPQNTSPIDALTRDLQAESVISQAVAVAGGVKALTAIADYTASATATYQQDQHEVQTTVTIMARGLHKLRIDSYLPGGVRSQATTLGKTTVKTESGTVTPARGQTAKNPGNLALPSLHLRSALTNPSFSLSYMGIVTLNGQSAHFIRVTFGPPHQEDLMSIRSSPWRTTDFYIDASTFQILMTQDVVRRSARYSARTSTRYSDYRPVNGVLVPFAISQDIEDQQIWSLRLDQITFNTGLTDSTFEITR